MEVYFMTQRKALIRLSLAPLLVAGIMALPAGLEAQAVGGAQAIDRTTLEGPIRFLADDLLEGRDPGSRGDKLTQLYLASTLEMLGYEPGGEDGSYLQTFDIVGIDAKAPETWAFRKGGQTLALKWSDQYIAASGVQKDRSEIKDAELVFVGYGIQAPEYQWDDFKGMDLKGKVLVMLNNDPDWDPKLFEGNRRLYYGRWTYKYESAARQGAAGAIIIHTTPSAGYGWQVVQTSWTGEQFELPAEKEPRIQVSAWTTEDAARQLVKLGGKDLDDLVKQARSRDFKPVPLGVTTSLVLENKIARKTTANVGGVLRGSDPKLRNEVVVYTAHHDHLGIGTPDAEGDTIYNGAVDNASGSAEILAVAKAFASMPERPKRSILVLFVAAEEQGLLGSLYYSRHPTFAPGRIAANINLDSGNIFGRTEDVVYIGLGKSSLDEVLRNQAAKQGRTVVGDQFPDKGSFYRSDQLSFARIGVPAIYLHGGTKFRGRPETWGKEKVEAWEAAHYHQASDELTPDWNFDGMVEDARLVFEAGLQIANTDQLPAWNPGDEFEAARKSALATAGK
jgi:Zn-dependent M28 family amino/carboxypeptidase